jgi:hypothetical protein
MTPLADRLHQSRQYRHMIEQQHADARQNIAYHERKLAEAVAEESRLQHVIGMLEAEERVFLRKIDEEKEEGE